MKYTYRIRMRAALWAVLGMACLAPVPTMAQGRDMGCSSTVANPCRDPSPSTAPGGGGYRAPSYDYEASRRAQEAAEAAATAERQRQAEADRIERERLTEEKRKKDEEFIRRRNEAAGTLRGSIGTTVGTNTPGGTELRGSQVDTGIREIRHERADRDLGGRQAAWKQLHCAASILGPALSALKIDGAGGATADYSEFRYLADEALNALNGQKLGVECSKAPLMPQYSGPAADTGKMVEAEKRLVVKARDFATKLEDARRVQTDARAKMSGAGAATPAPTPAIDSRTAGVVEQQRRINRERDNAANEMARTQREFNEGKRSEESAKIELRKIQKVAETLVRGEIVTFVEEAPRKPAARPHAASADESRRTRTTGSAAP